MTLLQEELRFDIPDLRELPLDRLAELGDSVLADSIALYRRRINLGYSAYDRRGSRSCV
jgi:hypothetical protein